MNKIWLTIIIFCLLYGLITGKSQEMSDALLNSSSEALKLLLTIGGLIIFYNGIFQIAIDSKLITFLSMKMMWLTVKLFPNIKKENICHEYITANLIANLLGLGIAATPMALKALIEMKKLNSSDEASNEMITLILLNVTSFTILPITILSIRDKYNPEINLILIPIIISVTFLLSVCGIFLNNMIIRWQIKKQMVKIDE